MKHHTKNEYADAKEIPELKPLLKGWIGAIKKYNEFHAANGPEFAWWHRERACIGFLAAAAWQTGGVALEEWCTTKGEKTAPRKGRSDLYLRTQEGCPFHIEAKRMWVTVTSKNDMGDVEDQLELAKTDCIQLQMPDEEPRLAVLFVSPQFKPGKQNNMRDDLSDWLERIENKFPDCAIAWVFDEDSLKFKKARKGEEAGKVTPGIVMLVLFVGRNRKPNPSAG